MIDWNDVSIRSHYASLLSATSIYKLKTFLQSKATFQQFFYNVETGKKARKNRVRIAKQFWNKIFYPKTIGETERSFQRPVVSESTGDGERRNGSRLQTEGHGAFKVDKQLQMLVETSCLFVPNEFKSLEKEIKRKSYYANLADFFYTTQAKEYFSNPFARLFYLQPFESNAMWDWGSTLDSLKEGKKPKEKPIHLEGNEDEFFSGALAEYPWDQEGNLDVVYLCGFLLQCAAVSEVFPFMVWNRYFSNRYGNFPFERLIIDKGSNAKGPNGKPWFEDCFLPVLNEKDIETVVKRDLGRVEFNFSGRFLFEKREWVEKKKGEYVKDTCELLQIMGKKIVGVESRFILPNVEILASVPNKMIKQLEEENRFPIVYWPMKLKFDPDWTRE